MYSYIHKCAHDACPQAASGWLIDETKAPPRITKKPPRNKRCSVCFLVAALQQITDMSSDDRGFSRGRRENLTERQQNDVSLSRVPTTETSAVWPLGSYTSLHFSTWCYHCCVKSANCSLMNYGFDLSLVEWILTSSGVPLFFYEQEVRKRWSSELNIERSIRTKWSRQPSIWDSWLDQQLQP